MTENKQDGESGAAEPTSFVRYTVTLEVALQLADMVIDGLDSNESSYEGIRSMKYDILDTIQSAVNDGLNQIDPDLLLIWILSLFLRNSYLGSKFPVDIINSKTGETIIPRGRKTGMSLLRRLASNHMYWAVDDPILAKDLSTLREKVISKCEALHHALKS
tara:strand:+ start:1803 stop:2285 length:483 start_codon:yes stop_codon:yes gene_type:complete